MYAGGLLTSGIRWLFLYYCEHSQPSSSLISIPNYFFLQRYDLTGAMVFDSFPRFDLPLQLVGTFDRPSRPPTPRLQGLLNQPMSPTFLPAGQALKMVSSIADIININSRRSSFWEKDTDAIRLIGPCIHFLLSIPRLPSEYLAMTYPEDLIAREMVRLTCLMLMSKLKELFKFPPSEQVALHARLVEFFSQNMKRLGQKYKELKTWALVTIILLQYHTREDMYIREMEREISGMDKLTPSELTDIARDIIWIDILMSPFSEDLLVEMTLRAVPLGAC